MKKHQLPYAVAITALTCFIYGKTFAQDWHVAGNSGTNASTNFIGTIDNKGLSFRTNNATRMRISPGGNIGIGTTNPVQKLDVNGNINIGAGFSLFMENQRVLRTDGSGGNTFLGIGTGSKNTSNYNTATGYQALFSNTSGGYNTANGYQALYSNTTGYQNTATGLWSLYSNTTGSSNVANGTYALTLNTTGYYNTASGHASLYANTTGNNNTANGYYSLYSNSTGAWNTATGDYALYSNTAGYYNTGVGTAALYYTTGSQYNTAVGYLAGDSYNNGWNNVFLGANTDVNGSGYYNVIAIGQGTICTDVSQARIGNSATSSIGGYANWTNISDVRVKKNIKQNVPGLSFINRLQPITYNLDLAAAEQITQPPAAKDKDGRAIQPTAQEIESKKAKEKVLYTGFAAQEVERAAKELDFDFSGVDAAKNSKDLYGLRYAEFVVPLVKAVQELSQQNEEMKRKIEKLETAMLEKNPNEVSALTSKNIAVTDASLGQNTPNPFNRSTNISYSLPGAFSSAQIIINDKNGRAVKQLNISSPGKGTVNIDASMLSSGTYSYSLIVDGKLVNSKQMVLAK